MASRRSGCVAAEFVLVFACLSAGSAQAPDPAQDPPQTKGNPAADEDFHVYTDAPRILLSKARLRLLQRERERQSPRWQQFDALISGGAPMPEPGFAWALYFQVARDPAAGKRAVDWALSDRADAQKDLRQLAIVFDWCAPVMTKAQADKLGEKIERGMAGTASGAAASGDSETDMTRQSARAMAAIAIADQLPDHANAVLSALVVQWWRGIVIKRIEKGLPPAPREQFYAMYEMMHAIRDNLKIELRDDASAYFRTLPIDHLSGHYPPPLESPENEYRVPIYVRDGDPDITDATMSRAAELAMVAYDPNALESQFVQGWLMQDRFLMRGGLGAVYEFLWANPYQPGLSYFHVPLIFHDTATGHLFARTSWDEDATWLGYFDGHLQLFEKGQVQTLRAGAAIKPVNIGDAMLVSADGKESMRLRATTEAVFILNLTPRASYDVEVDDQELWEAETDIGGTLVLSFPEGVDSGVRIRKRLGAGK